jgi:hypothetical protein
MSKAVWQKEASDLVHRLATLTDKRIHAILVPDNVSTEWMEEFTVRVSTLLDHRCMPDLPIEWVTDRKRKDPRVPWVEIEP